MNELDQEKHTVKQCCDLIDEKRALQERLSILERKYTDAVAQIHSLSKFRADTRSFAHDILYLANNFSSVADPLQQIRDNVRLLLEPIKGPALD